MRDLIKLEQLATTFGVSTEKIIYWDNEFAPNVYYKLANEIIKYALKDNNARKIILKNLKKEMFLNEDYILFKLIRTHNNDSYYDCCMDRDYLKSNLTNQCNVIKNNSNIELHIDLVTSSELDAERVKKDFINNVLRTFDKLIVADYKTDNLYLLLELFLDEYNHFGDCNNIKKCMYNIQWLMDNGYYTGEKMLYLFDLTKERIRKVFRDIHERENGYDTSMTIDSFTYSDDDWNSLVNVALEMEREGYNIQTTKTKIRVN